MHLSKAIASAAVLGTLTACGAGAVTHAPSQSTAPNTSQSARFRITPMYCGKFSAAQRTQFGTNARGGFIYRYANDGTIAGAPDVSVNFTVGNTVAGSNNAGADIPLADQGHDAYAEVDALTRGGGQLSFTGCQIMGFHLVTAGGEQ